MKLAAFPKCYMDELCVHRTMSVFDWIALAREHLKPPGVTGLEMYPGFFPETSAAYLSEVKAALDEAGFAMPMLCASPDFTSPDPAHRAAQVENHRRMIDLSASLGGETCRVLSGQRRPEVSREQGVAWVVECITALLPHAQERGVTLTMENHFKDNYWQYPEFAQKMDIFLEIVERIDSPHFGVNFDPSNTLLAGEDPLLLLDRVKHRVVTLHASDRRPRPGALIGPEGITDYSQLIHGEIGTGSIDFDAVFALLRAARFDGWISIEDGTSGIEELQRSAVFLAGKIGIAAAGPAQ